MAVVTVADYRLRTGDRTSPYTLAQRLIADATLLVESALGRFLESAQRTESLLVHPLVHPIGSRRGRMWPRAFPVSAVASPSGVIVEGAGALLAVALDDLDPPYSAPHSVDVTYTGGYSAVTLPMALRFAIIDVANATRAESPMTFPFAASSVSMGDAAVRFADADADTAMGYLNLLVAGSAGLLAEHRHPRVFAWGFA